MKRTILSMLLVVATSCATPVPAVNTPVSPVTAPVEKPVIPTPTPDPPRPYDGHIKYFAGWTPNAGTPDPTFTNTIMLQWDCGDPQKSNTDIRGRISGDSRAIVLHTGLMGWGNEGYAVEDPSVITSCWPIERAFINDYRSRILEVHTADEPPDVAWSYWQNGVYNPNRYNDDLSTMCTTVHADFPDLPCAVNYGSLPQGLVIPSGINHVWLETYDTNWHAKLDTLTGLTPLPLALMPPGFVFGDPTALDAQEAGVVNSVWAEAQSNPRVTLLVFFIPCCDDTTTGTKNFFTVGGGHLPLTLRALQTVGNAIKGG